MVGLTVPVFDTMYLVVELTGFENNTLQVFWSEDDDRYSEEQSITTQTTKGRKTYIVPIENALYLDKVRIDPQQGKREHPPKPILLHSISYHFKWFFDSEVLDDNFKGIDVLQGFNWPPHDSASDEITFTHSDPKLEFVIKLKLRFLQLFLPLLFLLGLYFFITYLISMSCIKGEKNLYQVDLFIHADNKKSVDGILVELKNKQVISQMTGFSSSVNGLRIQFVSELQSISSLYRVLKNLDINDQVSRFQIIANRGGEIA